MTIGVVLHALENAVCAPILLVLALFAGGMTISLVVSPPGSVQDLAITSPPGLGLDEKAVEAVSQWKLEPAMREGESVPVTIMVQCEFRLY